MRPSNRTTAWMYALGWQGGTIHQVAEESGVSVSFLLGQEPLKNKMDVPLYQLGYLCGLNVDKTKELVKQAMKVHKGHLDFWYGLADGVIEIFK